MILELAHPNYNTMSVRTSRKDLYEMESESENESVTLPNIEFEFIEVSDKNEVQDQQEEEPAEPEEFAFPLFSAPSADVMTVTLKEDAMEEEINNERPETYYRAIYNDNERKQFSLAAVDASFIIEWSQTSFPDSSSHKVLNVEEYNALVEQERKRHRKRRAGKKKREGIIACRARKQEREKEAKKLRREQQAREKKKKFKKWTGANAKPREKVVLKPKYRTE